MHSKLVILAAGASSRMKRSLLKDISPNEVDQLSKALIRLGKKNRPLLFYFMDHAKKAGYTEIFLLVGQRYESFKMRSKGLIQEK